MPSQNSKKIEDHIPAIRLDDEMGRVILDALSHDTYQAKIRQMIADHTDSVPFMKKVQGYADEQIDKRLFKNAKVTAKLIFGWFVSIAIAVVISMATQ